MEIPNRLNEILLSDATLHGAVEIALQDFAPWLRSSGMPFFPEYTDHSPGHIDDVLRAAELLINEEAWPCITPQDAATLRARPPSA